MATVSPRQLVSENCKLYSLPEIVLRLNEMVDDPACSAADFGNVISRDPALSARLLRVVNSPLYGFPSQVDTIPMAITILGTRQLRDLVLATSVVSTFENVTGSADELTRFWRHSTCCGVAAREVAMFMRLAYVERLFIAGLLHDIGKLLVQATLPERYQQLLERMQSTTPSTQRNLEKEIFGFDHAEVSEELLRRWNLPDALIEPIAAHHAPWKAVRFQHDAYALHLANYIANQIEPPLGIEDDTTLNDQTWAALGLREDQLPELIELVTRKLEAATDILSPEKPVAVAG